jgi:hypothetical protein
MSKGEVRETVLSIGMTDELRAALEALHETWRADPHKVPRGLSCSESSDGAFVLVAAESVFTTLPGACVVKGLGAIALFETGEVFPEGAHSKSLILRDTPDGWRFSVKFVAPVERARKAPRP